MVRGLLTLAALAVRLCRGKASFRKCGVSCLCLLGLYLVVSTTIKSNSGYSEQHGGLVAFPQQLAALAGSVYHNGREKVFSTSVSSPRVLLLYDRASSLASKGIRSVLESQRIPFDAHLHNENVIVHLERVIEQEDGGGASIVGVYCLIICADAVSLHWRWSRPLLDRYLSYSKRYNVTIVNFAWSDSPTHWRQIRDWSILSIPAKSVLGVRLNPSRKFFYLRNDEWFTNMDHITRNGSWTGFVLSAQGSKELQVMAFIKYRLDNTSHDQTVPLAFVSRRDGVREVFLGSPVSFWMTKVLLLEIVRSYSTRPLLRFGKKRWIMIDIDDIFLAPQGLRMNTNDVQVNFV